MNDTNNKFELPAVNSAANADSSFAQNQNSNNHVSINSDTTANPPITLPYPVSSTPEPNTQSVEDKSLPVRAEDDDLIEKEWVDKAKQIVGHTKEDPFIQTRELNKFKAEYIKKRYNKDIKISEDQ